MPRGRTWCGGVGGRACVLALTMLTALMVVMGCERGTATPAAPQASKTIRVVASIPPIRGVVEPILQAAEVKYDLQTLVPAGVSEHGYEIPPSKLGALDEADVVVLVGMGMEPQVEKYLKQHERKGRRVVVLAEALKIKDEHPAGESDHHDHDHAHGDDDHEHGADPHIWLDPVLVERMVGECAKTLVESMAGDAEAAKRIDAAKEQVAERVRGVDESYRTTLAKAEKRTIVVSHDAWGYLARRYNLKTVAIKGLLASEPTPASMAAATKAIQDEGVRVIFVEPQISAAAAKRIAGETGATVRTLDPLGDGDWFKMMESNLQAIAAALGVKTESAPPVKKE